MVKLALLWDKESSARMICVPDCHFASATTVSVNAPLRSDVIIESPSVSVMGMEVSRVRPIRARGLKFVPLTVIIAPRATVAGVAWGGISLLKGGFWGK